MDIWRVDLRHINRRGENMSSTQIFRSREKALNEYRVSLIERYIEIFGNNDIENLANNTLLEEIESEDCDDEWDLTVEKVTFDD